MDQPIPWPTIIRGLTSSGLTQPEIAQLCGCGQSTISDLVRCATTDPRTSTGLKLLALAKGRGINYDTAINQAANEQGVSDAA